MRLNQGMMCATGAFLVSSVASGSVFTIWASAPAQVLPGETYTVEFWGSVESPQWVSGDSAVAGFWVDVAGSGNIASLSQATLAEWARFFRSEGTVDRTSLQNVSGWQWSCPLLCKFMPTLENPLLMFSIEVTAGGDGSVTVGAVARPGDIAMSYYPSWIWYDVVTAQPDGSNVVMHSATTIVVPGPMSASVVLTGLRLARRRR